LEKFFMLVQHCTRTAAREVLRDDWLPSSGAGQREVLANGPEAGEKRLRAPRVAKPLHLSLTPARGLRAVSRAVIYPCASLHEDMLTAARSGTSAFAAG
jgi:hypothetical protein